MLIEKMFEVRSGTSVFRKMGARSKFWKLRKRDEGTEELLRRMRVT